MSRSCAPLIGNKRLLHLPMMSLSPRRVRITPTVALYECRLLKCTVKTASLLRHVEQRVKKWRGMQRWSLQCYCSARGEVVVQAVVERAAVASRVDNLLQAWRKLVAKMLPGVQAKQLKRGVWCNEVLVDVRVMVEEWETACVKLGAEAAVDGGAVQCTYLEPALPNAAASNSLSSSLPSAAIASKPSSAIAAKPAALSAAPPLPSAAPKSLAPRPLISQKISAESSAKISASFAAHSPQVSEKPRPPLLITLG